MKRLHIDGRRRRACFRLRSEDLGGAIYELGLPRRDLLGMFTCGIAAEVPECARLAAILDASRFKQPDRRRVKLERHHVEAFVAEALRNQRLSLALGTSLQFDTALRQRDVIGEWEPLPDGVMSGGIVLNRRRWATA